MFIILSAFKGVALQQAGREEEKRKREREKRKEKGRRGREMRREGREGNLLPFTKENRCC